MRFRAPRTAIAAALGTVLGCAMVTAGCSSSTPQPSATLGGGPRPTLAVPGVTTATPTSSVTLPADYTVNIELNITGTATQVQLLTQAKALVLAYEQALERNAPTDPLYQTMVSGVAKANLYQSITAYKNASQRPTGTVVFYRFSTYITTTSSDALFCEDPSQVKLVNFTTGAALANTATDTEKQFWDVGFDKNADGTWSIDYVATQAGSNKCT